MVRRQNSPPGGQPAARLATGDWMVTPARFERTTCPLGGAVDACRNHCRTRLPQPSISRLGHVWDKFDVAPCPAASSRTRPTTRASCQLPDARCPMPELTQADEPPAGGHRNSGKSCGDPGAIRTRDLPLRRRPLYPAELRGQWGGNHSKDLFRLPPIDGRIRQRTPAAFPQIPRIAPSRLRNDRQPATRSG